MRPLCLKRRSATVHARMRELVRPCGPVGCGLWSLVHPPPVPFGHLAPLLGRMRSASQASGSAGDSRPGTAMEAPAASPPLPLGAPAAAARLRRDLLCTVRPESSASNVAVGAETSPVPGELSSRPLSRQSSLNSVAWSSIGAAAPSETGPNIGLAKGLPEEAHVAISRDLMPPDRFSPVSGRSRRPPRPSLATLPPPALATSYVSACLLHQAEAAVPSRRLPMRRKPSRRAASSASAALLCSSTAHAAA